MYDVANMKYVNYLLIRAEAVEKRNAKKRRRWPRPGEPHERDDTG